MAFFDININIFASNAECVCVCMVCLCSIIVIKAIVSMALWVKNNQTYPNWIVVECDVMVSFVRRGHISLFHQIIMATKTYQLKKVTRISPVLTILWFYYIFDCKIS